MSASIGYFIPARSAKWVSGLIQGNNIFTHNLGVSAGVVQIRKIGGATDGEEVSAKVTITPTTIIINSQIARPNLHNITFIGA